MNLNLLQVAATGDSCIGCAETKNSSARLRIQRLNVTTIDIIDAGWQRLDGFVGKLVKAKEAVGSPSLQKHGYWLCQHWLDGSSSVGCCVSKCVKITVGGRGQ